MVRRLVILSIMLILIVFYSRMDWAASWRQDGTFRVSAEYETNPSMVLANSSGVWQSAFAPSYTLTRTSDINELNAGVSLRIVRASNKALSQDRNDPGAFLGWNGRSEAGNFAISAKYDETSTRISEMSNIGPGIAELEQGTERTQHVKC